MPTASQAINSAISKGRDIVGAGAVLGDVVSSLPGIPSSLKGAISTLFGTGTGAVPSANRRDLSNFIGTVSKLGGFTRPAYFYVEIRLPKALIGSESIESTRTLAFLCESASLPGVSLATTDIKRFGIGPVEKKPYAPTFADSTMTFFNDASGVIHQFFYKWMNSIVRFDSPTLNNVKVAYNSLAPFEVSYKDEYAVDILITTVDERNKEIINVRLFDAFPIFMGDVTLGWGDTDSISRIPITFTYYNWAIENIPVSPEAYKANSGGFIQNLIKAGTAIQTLASIKKPNNVADIINVVNNAKIVIGAL